MKRLSCFVVLLVFCLSIFAISVNPSMDGRAVVADEGVFPPGGYYGRAPGYLPGDTVVVTNHNNGFSIDVLILGTYDAYEGIAILLSPEAADKLQIAKGKDVYVKVQKKQPMSYEEAVATSKNKKANQVVDTDKDSSVLPGETEQLVNDVIASKNNSEIPQETVEQEPVSEVAEVEEVEPEYIAEEETIEPEEIVEVAEIPQETVEQEPVSEVAEVEEVEPEYIAEEETIEPEEIVEVAEIPQEILEEDEVELAELDETEEYFDSESIDSPIFEVVEENPVEEENQEIEVAEELPEEKEEVVLDDIQNEDFDDADFIDTPVESEIADVTEEVFIDEEILDEENEVAEQLPEEKEEVVLDDIQNEDFDEADFIDTPIESEIAEVTDEEILPVEEIVVEEIPEEIAELEEVTEENIEDEEFIVLEDVSAVEEDFVAEEVVEPLEEEFAELPEVETEEEVTLEEISPEDEIAELEEIEPEYEELADEYYNFPIYRSSLINDEPYLYTVDDIEELEEIEEEIAELEEIEEIEISEETAKSVAENPKDIFSMIVGEDLEDDIIEDVVLEEAEPKLPELDDSYFEETEVADIEIQLDEPEAKIAEIISEPEPVAVVNDEIKSVIAKEENKNEEFANTVSDFKDLPKVKNAKSSTYYIQIATVNKKENVAKMIDLHGKKYPVYVIKNPAKSSYQILVGPLNDDEYALVLARFKQTYKDAFLRVAK